LVTYIIQLLYSWSCLYYLHYSSRFSISWHLVWYASYTVPVYNS